MLPRDVAACAADDCPLHQRCERWMPEPSGDGLPRVWAVPPRTGYACDSFIERESRNG